MLIPSIMANLGRPNFLAKPPDDRYQYQSWPVRAYRWLRWRPFYVAMFVWWFVRWVLTGAKTFEFKKSEGWYIDMKVSRRETIDQYWGSFTSLYQYRVKYYYTLDEIREALNK